MSPNGNGGLHEAIKSSGALDDMIKRGVEYLHVYGVDNILVKVADPSFMGYCAMKNADAANKVLLKEDPHEKVGVMALRGKKFGVVEYSEISKEMAEQRGKDGQLTYSGGNIAQHMFSVQFMKDIACDAKLPFHIAKKVIPVCDDEGKQIIPPEPNGMKLEMFVFDVFAFAKNLVCFAVKREEEFTALKNKPGEKGGKLVGDSPDTARRDYCAFHVSMAKKAGAKINITDDVYETFEISPLVSYEGEGLDAVVSGQVYTAPYNLELQIEAPNKKQCTQ